MCFPVGGSVSDIQQTAQDNEEQRDQSREDPVEVIIPDVYNPSNADGSRDPFSAIWSRKLRVKITGKDGYEKLDIRIPVSLLSSMMSL